MSYSKMQIEQENPAMEGLSQPKNEQRAERINPLLVEFDEPQDVLSDLMHWCDHSAEDFDNLLRIARANYEAEIEEERTTYNLMYVIAFEVPGCLTPDGRDVSADQIREALYKRLRSLDNDEFLQAVGCPEDSHEEVD